MDMIPATSAVARDLRRRVGRVVRQLPALHLAGVVCAPRVGDGGGHGGGQGGGHSSQGGSGAHGKSANAGGNGKSGNVRTSPRQDRQLAAIGKQTRAEKRQIRVDDVKTARATAKSLREREVTELPDTVFVPTAKPEDKNLHARLAGLNSLQRNYHAYLNSQSPRMAGIAAYVMASAQLALAQVPSEELLAATDGRHAARPASTRRLGGPLEARGIHLSHEDS